jgi:hypothetical protein
MLLRSIGRCGGPCDAIILLDEVLPSTTGAIEETDDETHSYAARLYAVK